MAAVVRHRVARPRYTDERYTRATECLSLRAILTAFDCWAGYLAADPGNVDIHIHQVAQISHGPHERSIDVCRQVAFKSLLQ